MSLFLTLAERGDAAGVGAALLGDPSLAMCVDNLGRSAAHFAARGGGRHLGVLAALAGAETASLTLRDMGGREPIVYAARAGSVESVTWLLSRGLGANGTAADKKGLTPLHHAIFSSNDESAAKVVALLISRGADTRALDGEGLAARQHAVLKDFKLTALLLGEGEADLGLVTDSASEQSSDRDDELKV